MKKSLKVSILAVSAVLALGMVGCKQPEAPEPSVEAKLATPRVSAKSVFGQNVLTIEDVKWAKDYTIYRYGPEVKGKKIEEINPKAFSVEDGIKGGLHEFYYADSISINNVLEAGNYLYKVVANPASEIDANNGSRLAKAPSDYYWDSSDAANVWVTVPAENVPPYRTKMAAPAITLADTIQYEDDNTKYIEIIPGKGNGLKLDAKWVDPINGEKLDDGTNLNDVTFTSATKLALPKSTALNGKWEVSVKTPAAFGIYNRSENKTTNYYYLDSDPVVLTTMEIKGNVVPADQKINVVATPDGFNFTVNKEFKEAYDVTAMKSLVTVYNGPKDDGDDKLTSTNVYADPVKANLEVTWAADESNDKFVVATAKDKDLKAEDTGKKYVYFYTLTPKEGKTSLVKQTGAVEVNASTKWNPKLTWTVLGGKTVTPQELKNADGITTGYRVAFSLVPSTPSDVAEADKFDLAKDAVVSVTRVPVDKDNKTAPVVLGTSAFKIDDKDGKKVLTVLDETFVGDDKKYQYDVVVSKVTSRGTENYTCAKAANIEVQANKISSYIAPTVDSFSVVQAAGSTVATPKVDVTLKLTANKGGTAISDATNYTVKYVLRENTTDAVVANGAINAKNAAAGTVNAGVAIALPLVKGREYTLYYGLYDGDNCLVNVSARKTSYSVAN